MSVELHHQRVARVRRICDELPEAMECGYKDVTNHGGIRMLPPIRMNAQHTRRIKVRHKLLVRHSRRCDGGDYIRNI
jgi:hypothetical protein